MNGFGTSVEIVNPTETIEQQATFEPKAGWDALEEKPFGPDFLTVTNPLGQSADAELADLAWYRMSALTEDYVRGSDVLSAAVDRCLTFTVGDGFNINPNTGDPELDDIIEQWYRVISVEASEIDYDGKFNLTEMLRSLHRAAIVNGDMFAVFVNDNGKALVELIEGYRCKSPYLFSDEEKRVIDGVKLAPTSRREIGYYFNKDVPDWYSYGNQFDPDSYIYRDSTDLSGEKTVVHFTLPSGRPSETRPVGAIAPSLAAVCHHHHIRFNTAAKTEIANAITEIRGIDPKATPATAQAISNQINKLYEQNQSLFTKPLKFKAGEVRLNPPGMKSEIFSPNIPNQEFFSMDMLLVKALASTIWVPAEILLCDASEANFSALRLIDRSSHSGGFRRYQNNLHWRFLRHWWRFKFSELIATNHEVRSRIEKLAREGKPYDPSKATWDYPGYKSLDPEVDTDTDNTMMATGQASDSEIFQIRGRNFLREMPRIASDSAWRIELLAKEVLKLHESGTLAQISTTPREAFFLLYSRTSPEGHKSVEVLSKIITADNGKVPEETSESEQEKEKTAPSPKGSRK